MVRDPPKFGMGREIFPRAARGVNTEGDRTTGRVKAKSTTDGISQERGFKELGFTGLGPHAEPVVTESGWYRGKGRERGAGPRPTPVVIVAPGDSIIYEDEIYEEEIYE